MKILILNKNKQLNIKFIKIEINKLKKLIKLLY